MTATATLWVVEMKQDGVWTPASLRVYLTHAGAVDSLRGRTMESPPNYRVAKYIRAEEG